MKERGQSRSQGSVQMANIKNDDTMNEYVVFGIPFCECHRYQEDWDGLQAYSGCNENHHGE